MTTSDAPPTLEDVLGSAREELERLRRELAEMDVNLRQTNTEVDKLTQRDMTLANRLRDLEVNIDRYSKTDIKNMFTSAQEVQMRLLMMRAQLEQLQVRHNALKQRQSQLVDVSRAIEAHLAANPRASVATARSNGDDELIAGIIQAQEKERLRISLQMHDGPAQSLSNLVLRAEICQRMIDRDVDQARAELGSLKTAINTTLQDTRRFIFDLRPMILDDLGLIPTLRRYVQQFSEKNNIEVNLMVQGVEGRLPNHYEVALFRFIQEALNNVVKHAQAGAARITIDATGHEMRVAVEDDGSGFHVNEVLAETGRLGHKNLGINSMRQQIETLLRGEFGIESAIGRGTRVAAAVPLP